MFVHYVCVGLNGVLYIGNLTNAYREYWSSHKVYTPTTSQTVEIQNSKEKNWGSPISSETSFETCGCILMIQTFSILCTRKVMHA